MELEYKLQEHLDAKHGLNVLKKHVKTSDIETTISKALNAIATPLTNNELKLTMTLMSRLIGQALNADANANAQVKLGAAFLNFLHSEGLVKFEQLTSSQWTVEPVDVRLISLLDTLSRVKRVQNITIHPGDWHKPFNRGVPIVKKLSADEQHYYTQDKMPLVYRALNLLGSTQWMINSALLQLMIDGLDGFTPVITEAELSEARAFLNSAKRSSERFKVWMKNKTNMRSVDIKVKAKDWFKTESKEARFALGKDSVANDFLSAIALAADVEYETLYFQHNLDSRGRIYALSNVLHPQGPDHHKALLRFVHSGPVDERWIYIHIANCAGQDKLSFDDRIQWTMDNLYKIQAVGKDPHSVVARAFYDEINIYKESKTKWQWLAACIELVQYFETGEWTIPVGVDATSSGLQFLAACSKDESLAQHVNISTCNYAPVGDVYQMIGNELIQQVDLTKAPALTGLGIGDKPLRKLCKRSAMTYPYSCKGDSMGEHLYEDRGGSDGDGYGHKSLDMMSFKECAYLGNLQYEVIQGALPRAAAAMQAMQDCFTGYKGDPTVTWHNPVGFRVTQHKPATKNSKVQLEFDNHPTVQVVVYAELSTASTSKHKQAISPNVIHSLDSSMMVMSICAAADAGVYDFHAVHDQMGSYSGCTDLIGHVARKAFYDIVTSDPIKSAMDEAVPGKYKAPKQGAWNPSDVLTSAYFLC